jgi:hypothetical protein
MKAKGVGGSNLRFCTLAYIPDAKIEDPRQIGTKILLATAGEEEGLRLFVHPNLTEIVKPEDASFIEQLFEDFVQRAKDAPADLFEQLCSLSVGSLLTVDVGDLLTSSSPLTEPYSQFVPL